MAFNIDAQLSNSDWTKMSWDLPPYDPASYLRQAGGTQELAAFKALPVYKHAVRNGLIVKDRWMGSRHGYDGRGPRPAFAEAVAELDQILEGRRYKFSDEQAVSEVRRWLDGLDDDSHLDPLPWAGSGVTADEWFFITTMYVPMNLRGQRTIIRRHFPEFVREAGGDIRGLSPELVNDWVPRFPFVRLRLRKMSHILGERCLSMEEYTEALRGLDRSASFEDPAPALDAIISDHAATSWKTLSCYIRDCVRGACFPIDTRVSKVLKHYGLELQLNGGQLEWQLVNLCRSIQRNPREVARMFYAAADNSEPKIIKPNRVVRPKRVPELTGVHEFAGKDNRYVAGVQEFSGNDKRYQEWVTSHPRGFVVNTAQVISPEYMTVHKASCGHVSNFNSHKPGAFTERDYMKACSTDLDCLREWAKAHGRADGSFTGKCRCNAT